MAFIKVSDALVNRFKKHDNLKKKKFKGQTIFQKYTLPNG